MTKIRLAFVQQFKDRHGTTRRYFRRPGFKRLPLPGLPGSEEFMAAYQAALDGVSVPKAQPGSARTVPGTINALCVRFYKTAKWAGLSDSTKATYRSIIEGFRVDHGEKRVAMIGRQHIKHIHESKLTTPTAANNWLKIVRMLLDLAVEEGLRQDNPAASVKGVHHETDGHPSWSESQIGEFRKRHTLGTRARPAMELLYGTAQRRSDAVKLGRQHLRGGVLSFRQQKTHQSIDIPVLPELQAAIDAMPKDNATFLTTEQGKPFTAAGFGNWFREVCTEAGLPKGYAAHGLRKAAATRLAEAGCTDHQIMAWGGWRTLREVNRYTERADRARLAQAAGSEREHLVSNLPNGFDNFHPKPLQTKEAKMKVAGQAVLHEPFSTPIPC